MTSRTQVYTPFSRSRIASEFKRLGKLRWLRADVEGFPTPIYAYLDEVDGRPILAGLLLSPTTRRDMLMIGPRGVKREITARALRQIPLTGLIMLAKLADAVPEVARAIGGTRAADPYRPPHVRPGPKGWDREHFERVAAAYRSALKAHPRTPVRALISQFGCSEATVHRWLDRCRTLGLLNSRSSGAPRGRQRKTRTKR